MTEPSFALRTMKNLSIVYRQKPNKHGQYSIGVKVDEKLYKDLTNKCLEWHCSLQSYVIAALSDSMHQTEMLKELEANAPKKPPAMSKVHDLFDQKWGEWSEDEKRQIFEDMLNLLSLRHSSEKNKQA
tara:strand:+ start:780 stop:1163 length:384 start_codon:yes stop_codon:yes gene_type:complete